MQCGFKPLNKIKLVEDPKNSISYNQIFTENFCYYVQADFHKYSNYMTFKWVYVMNKTVIWFPPNLSE